MTHPFDVSVYINSKLAPALSRVKSLAAPGILIQFLARTQVLTLDLFDILIESPEDFDDGSVNVTEAVKT
jgi:hypothetical protein